MTETKQSSVELLGRSTTSLSPDRTGNRSGRSNHLCLGSAAVWAIVFYLLLNTGFSLATNLSRQSKKKAEQQGVTFQACDSAVEQFQSASKPPEVVLVGSSVLMAPLWSTDVKHFANVADVYHHHRSLELERLLSARALGSKQVFAFALPGLMVSDGYLLVDKLLVGKRTPEILVYGLAPRDFMDDLLTGETRTPVFQRLMQLEDLPRLGDLYLASIQEKADFVVNNIVFLYGKRWRYQDKVSALLKRAVSTLVPTQKSSGPADSGKVEQQFLLGQNKKQVWQKSIEEYRARYRHFDPAQFAKQEHFLEALVELAKQRQMKVMLVNMPLTTDNIKLLKNGFYARYRAALSNLATRHGCQLLDMQADRNYTDADFYDTVHLNESGGQRCLKSLANAIASAKEQQR
jgi:hypothetical protein